MAGEKLFENRVKRWLESEGVFPAGCPVQEMTVPLCGWYFKVWGGGFQKAGIPDLIINVNGFFFGVELKADKGRPSDLQKKNVAMINQGNGVGIILYPAGFEQFKQMVKGVKECNSAIPALNALKNAHSSTSCVIWTG
jgi:hypothetical protein